MEYYLLLFLVPFIGSFILFLLSMRKTNASMFSGFMFYVCVFSLGMGLAFIAVPYSENPVVYGLLLVVGIFLLVLLLGGVYILLAFLFVNTAVILKKENRSLGHMLTLVLAVLIIVFMLTGQLISWLSAPRWVLSIWSGLVAMLGYFILHILIFLSTLFVGNVFRPRRRRDYIIVLGSGLIDGKVPSLLQNRIKAAMKYGKKQEKRRGTAPYLVMSGGQGADEPLPEGAAMKAWAIEQGYPEDRILSEEESTTTKENFLFSKRLMDAHADGKRYRCIFSTSSYHLYRAGLYAKQAGLQIRGLGAKTAFYFLPNAVLREYIAYLVMRKKRFIIIAVVLFMLVGGTDLINGLLGR